MAIHNHQRFSLNRNSIRPSISYCGCSYPCLASRRFRSPWDCGCDDALVVKQTTRQYSPALTKNTWRALQIWKEVQCCMNFSSWKGTDVAVSVKTQKYYCLTFDIGKYIIQTWWMCYDLICQREDTGSFSIKSVQSARIYQLDLSWGKRAWVLLCSFTAMCGKLRCSASECLQMEQLQCPDDCNLIFPFSAYYPCQIPWSQ